MNVLCICRIFFDPGYVTGKLFPAESYTFAENVTHTFRVICLIKRSA